MSDSLMPLNSIFFKIRQTTCSRFSNSIEHANRAELYFVQWLLAETVTLSKSGASAPNVTFDADSAATADSRGTRSLGANSNAKALVV
jgi:hypothetical protein